MNAIGNLIWLVCGGFFSALGYFVMGFVFCVTIIGIPFGIQCFKIGMLELLPFGKRVVTKPSSGSCLSLYLISSGFLLVAYILLPCILFLQPYYLSRLLAFLSAGNI